jgi:Tfp pilus assembly protein PilF
LNNLAPNSLQVASTLHNLGNVAYSRGDLARAEQLYQQALAIYEKLEKLAPNSLEMAGTLHARFTKNLPPTRCRWH